MFDKATHTMIMTADQRRKYYDRLKAVGPFQIQPCGVRGVDGDYTHILLPGVETMCERKHHLTLLEGIETDMKKDVLRAKDQERQAVIRDARSNIKKFNNEKIRCNLTL